MYGQNSRFDSRMCLETCSDRICCMCCWASSCCRKCSSCAGLRRWLTGTRRSMLPSLRENKFGRSAQLINAAVAAALATGLDVACCKVAAKAIIVATLLIQHGYVVIDIAIFCCVFTCAREFTASGSRRCFGSFSSSTERDTIPKLWKSPSLMLIAPASGCYCGIAGCACKLLSMDKSWLCCSLYACCVIALSHGS